MPPLFILQDLYKETHDQWGIQIRRHDYGLLSEAICRALNPHLDVVEMRERIRSDWAFDTHGKLRMGKVGLETCTCLSAPTLMCAGDCRTCLICG